MHDRLASAGRRLGAAVICALLVLWIWAVSAKATVSPEGRGDVVVVLESDAA